MKLNEFLKTLQDITPDAEYSARSRRLILGDAPMPRMRTWRFFVHNFQFGGAVAFAALILVVVIGGASFFTFLAPFRLSSLDASSLNAEAQAVDIQVNLAKLSYPSKPRAAAVSVRATSTGDASTSATTTSSTAAAPLPSPAPSTTASSTVTADQVLDQLSK